MSDERPITLGVNSKGIVAAFMETTELDHRHKMELSIEVEYRGQGSANISIRVGPPLSSLPLLAKNVVLDE